MDVVILDSKEFLSTPSARRATRECPEGIDLADKFLSTPSARRATIWLVWSPLVYHISIHALREEGDRWTSSSFQLIADFYPRPP